MAGGLFASGAPTTLEQALGNQAQNAVAQTADSYTQARRRLVGQQAAQGRLMSGVVNYPLTDLAKEGAGAESDIYSNLAATLGSIPAEDWANANEYQRNLQLAKLIGEMNKPSTLQEALSGLNTAGHFAAMTAGAMK